jgi:Ran GTPase-activating protein (RanGAP) involved in mRNA processing and transport
LISITKWLGNLITLDLKISNYCIGEEGAFLLSNLLPNLVNLKILILDISNNNICYQGAKYLCNSLMNMKSLTKLELDLYNNNIIFPPKLSLLSHLENNISKEMNLMNDVEMLEEHHTNSTICENLKDLKINLKKNNLGPDLIKYLSTKIPNLISLRSLWLDLKWNIIDTKGAEAIASAIGNIRTLTKLYLNLECCRIRNQGASAVITQILQLSNLDNLILNLECNRINLEIKEVFSSRLEDFLKKIKIMNINLYNNFLSDENMKSLNIELSNF